MANDELIFAEESTDSEASRLEPVKPWVIAIVDDDEHVHDVTRLALKNFHFDGRPLEFVRANSGEEGYKLFQSRKDISVCLLDVVMESDHAGLDLAVKIREELNNSFVRIVLRTGQPGQAPEEDVIAKYDINDYKEKTELTRTKLHTVIYACLRSYRDIVALDQNRRGLERVIDATGQVFSEEFVEKFAQGVLQQVTSILQMQEDAFYGKAEGLAAHEEDDAVRIVAGVGSFERDVGKDVDHVLPESFLQAIKQQSMEFITHHDDENFMCAIRGKTGQQNILFLRGLKERTRLEKDLIEIYSRNVLVAFENLYLRTQIEETQREMLFLLGEAVENRSKETGYHLKRVSEYAYLLAIELGIPDSQARKIREASPLHDLGKIGIPDNILHKPGKLNMDEWEIMQTHVDIGYEMLRKSNKPVMKIAAKIARDHHERWDGKGYPRGLKGEDISIEGRILSVADVLDALLNKRCYKEPWELEDALDYIRTNSGSQFDPKVVAALEARLDEVRIICTKYQE